MMNKFSDRYEAGKILAAELQNYANNSNVIILALPRGGVPVASEIAKSLSAPLDVFIVRKLGVPGHEELAMGAMALGDAIIFNPDILKQLVISEVEIQKVIRSEQQELKRRQILYRGKKSFPNLKDKIIILVDDGIATGATIRVAIEALQKYQPQKIIVAVPVAAPSTIEEIENLVDETICPLRPSNFYAVGAWYDDFSQTTDEEVFELLNHLRE